MGKEGNFYAGVQPIKSSIWEHVRKHSGRTGTNVRKKVKTAGALYQELYAEALEKLAQDDVGMAGQVRASAPKTPKVKAPVGVLTQKPKVPGVAPPKVKVPTPTGLA